MNQPSLSLQGIDRGALERVIEPVVRAHGGEVVDIEYRREQQGWVLRVTVEKEGARDKAMSTRDAAVDLDLCAAISRDLGHALDVADLVPTAYHLEVGSPGVERKLRGERDFARFAGEKAKIKLRQPVAGQRVFVGVLAGTTAGGAAGTVRIADGPHTHELPLALVESARLVFEFPKQQREHKKKKH